MQLEYNSLFIIIAKNRKRITLRNSCVNLLLESSVQRAESLINDGKSFQQLVLGDGEGRIGEEGRPPHESEQAASQKITSQLDEGGVGRPIVWHIGLSCCILLQLHNSKQPTASVALHCRMSLLQLFELLFEDWC